MSRLDTKFKVIPAAYTLLRHGDEVLLLRRANTGYRDGEYSLPAGHIEADEPAIVAAARELQEETGLSVPLDNFRFLHVLHSISLDPEKHERVSFFFEVLEWDGEPYNAEPHKCDKLKWSNLASLAEGIVPEVRQALEKIFAGESYSDFGF